MNFFCHFSLFEKEKIAKDKILILTIWIKMVSMKMVI